MTAIGIRAPGGPEVLVPEERPVPVPAAGEILIKVAAAGVNRPDVVQRQGHYPPPPGASDIPGLEIAGDVVAAGPGAARFHIGDRVMALVTVAVIDSHGFCDRIVTVNVWRFVPVTGSNVHVAAPELVGSPSRSIESAPVHVPVRNDC